MTIAITGGAGFLGKFVSQKAIFEGQKVRILTRTKPSSLFLRSQDVEIVQVDYSSIDSLMAGLKDCSSIIHLAGIAHTTVKSDAEAMYRRVLIDYSINLWSAALRTGLKSFVFASSVKVFGDRSAEQPFNESSHCLPDGIYGRCKQEAENALLALSLNSPMRLCSIRLPPVYGSGARGSVRHLFRCAKHGWPLPFFRFNHRRSFISAENAAIIFLGAARNRLTQALYVACDHDPWDLADFYCRIYYSMHKAEFPKSRQWGMPHWLQNYLQNISALRPLLVPFEVVSNHQEELNALGLVDTETAMQNAAVFFR